MTISKAGTFSSIWQFEGWCGTKGIAAAMMSRRYGDTRSVLETGIQKITEAFPSRSDRLESMLTELLVNQFDHFRV